MGPGYFPLLLAVLLALLGAALIVRSVVFSGEPVPRFHIWPLTVIAAAVCLFGVLIEPLGLAVSLAVLTVMSAWAGARLRWAETLALAAALIIFSAGVFVYALGLPLNIWPGL
jgi:putative tricarboxylic transport membrane protein